MEHYAREWMQVSISQHPRCQIIVLVYVEILFLILTIMFVNSDSCDSYEICGWGNQELEIYGAENVILKDDGILRIEARKVIDANGHVTYTSSRINTSGKADFGECF